MIYKEQDEEMVADIYKDNNFYVHEELYDGIKKDVRL